MAQIKKKIAQRKTNNKKMKLAKSKPSSHPTPVIGVIAPSGPAPQIELFQGGERIAKEGFEVFFHPQVTQKEAFFAGSDTERALAFLDYAFDSEINVLWAARGGYGVIRILPILDQITSQVGIPPYKTLIGFSDNTLLLEYVRERWGWRAIHGPMPATHHFERVKGAPWKNLMNRLSPQWKSQSIQLKSIYKTKDFKKVQGEVVGGNLCTIVSALKTPYELNLQGKILFLEEVSEAPYKIDRMIQQLFLSRHLNGVRAIVLGEFTDCQDRVPEVYSDLSKKKKKPMRSKISEKRMKQYIFGRLGEELGISVWEGLPIGHGKGVESLELGAVATIDQRGRILI